MALPRRTIQPIILQALREDLGRGDLTTNALIPPASRIRARIQAKSSGIVAGAAVARQVFLTVDRRLRCVIRRRDGQPVRRGQVILTAEGSARSILAAERVALNFLGHLSGIATLTHQFVQKVRGTRANILDTRKTTPGLRDLEKDAVRAGGGQNHRRGLDDAVLIKTNHLLVAGRLLLVARERAIQKAIAKAKVRARGRFIEIEVLDLKGFKAALQAKPDAILLDNWSISEIRKAVKIYHQRLATNNQRLLLEVSGGVTLQNVRRIARTGVDRISIGRLTHSAPALDVSLEVV